MSWYRKYYRDFVGGFVGSFPVLLVVCFVFLTGSVGLANPPKLLSRWVTDYPVKSIQVDEKGNSYIAGGFTRVGPRTGHGVVLRAVDGKVKKSFPMVTGGNVAAVIGDDAGGWYIAGSFTKVGGQFRYYLAHIKADGTLDQAWDPQPNGPVSMLAKNKTSLFFGGNFDRVSGENRLRLASVNRQTGLLQGWNPAPNNSVFELLPIGEESVLIAGDFSKMGEKDASYLARVDAVFGGLTSWNPQINNPVRSMGIDGNTLYVQGYFNKVAGQDRNQLAALDLTTAQLKSWYPKITSNFPRKLWVQQGRIYLAGYSLVINGASRSNIAALDSTGRLLDWDPFKKGGYYSVDDLLVYGNSVYLGIESYGVFTYDLNTAAQQPDWDPHFLGRRNSFVLAAQGEDLYVGGDFSSVGAQIRMGLASFDPAGELTEWDPAATTSGFSAIQIFQGRLLATGPFTEIDGKRLNYIASLDLATGHASRIAPADLSGPVDGFLATSDKLYFWGNKTGLTAVNPNTGDLLSWKPNPDGRVTRLVASNDRLYVIGDFNQIGGKERSFFAELDAATAQATDLDLKISGNLYDVAVRGDFLYLAGSFHRADSDELLSFGVFDLKNRQWSIFKPEFDGATAFLSVQPGYLFVGGNFDSVDGNLRQKVAVFDSQMSLSPYVLNLERGYSSNSPVLSAVQMTDKRIYLGGEFERLNDEEVLNFAILGLLPAVSFQGSEKDGIENLGTVAIAVVLSEPSDQEIKIPYRVKSRNALPDQDYQLEDGILTIPAGQTTANLNLQLVDNAQVDGDRMIEIELQESDAFILGQHPVLTYTIHDNDVPPVAPVENPPPVNGGGCSLETLSVGSLPNLLGFAGIFFGVLISLRVRRAMRKTFH